MKEIEKGRDFRERSSIFSLNFPMIGPSNSGETRGKVDPHYKSYTWETEVGEFQKTPRGKGFFPSWFNPCLRAIQMAWVV